MAKVKAANFRRNRAELAEDLAESRACPLSPAKLPAIFVGDNGQGDYTTAVNCEDDLALCLIHRVFQEGEQEETEKIKIFENYVEAAEIA